MLCNALVFAKSTWKGGLEVMEEGGGGGLCHIGSRRMVLNPLGSKGLLRGEGKPEGGRRGGLVCSQLVTPICFCLKGLNRAS